MKKIQVLIALTFVLFFGSLSASEVIILMLFINRLAFLSLISWV